MRTPGTGSDSCGPAPFDAVATLTEDGSAIADLAAASDPTASIPSCPGWAVHDLAAHVVDCWSFWAQVVGHRCVTDDDVRGVQPRVVGDDVGRDLTAALAALGTALDDADDDQPVWSWVGQGMTTSWLRRRMVHETAVHRWDLEHAVGRAFEVPTGIAADGVDEFLSHHAAHLRATDAAELDGTLRLRCVDVDHVWLVEDMTDGVCTFTRTDHEADATVSGRAHDLLMWLWGRSPVERLEVLGDATVADRFIGFGDLDF